MDELLAAANEGKGYSEVFSWDDEYGYDAAEETAAEEVSEENQEQYGEEEEHEEADHEYDQGQKATEEGVLDESTYVPDTQDDNYEPGPEHEKHSFEIHVEGAEEIEEGGDSSWADAQHQGGPTEGVVEENNAFVQPTEDSAETQHGGDDDHAQHANLLPGSNAHDDVLPKVPEPDDTFKGPDSSVEATNLAADGELAQEYEEGGGGGAGEGEIVDEEAGQQHEEEQTAEGGDEHVPLEAHDPEHGEIGGDDVQQTTQFESSEMVAPNDDHTNVGVSESAEVEVPRSPELNGNGVKRPHRPDEEAELNESSHVDLKRSRSS